MSATFCLMNWMEEISYRNLCNAGIVGQLLVVEKETYFNLMLPRWKVWTFRLRHARSMFSQPEFEIGDKSTCARALLQIQKGGRVFDG